jgi:hypothetical protein
MLHVWSIIPPLLAAGSFRYRYRSNLRGSFQVIPLARPPHTSGRRRTIHLRAPCLRHISFDGQIVANRTEAESPTALRNDC